MAHRSPPDAPEGPRPTDSGPARPAGRESLLLGGLLVVVGAILLLGQLLRIDVGHYGWPFFVIVPGALILLSSMTVRGAAREALSISGSCVTATGLILLVQNATDDFQSWAYAWTLIFPSAVGLGMVIYGLTAGRGGNVRAGVRLIGIGLTLFLVGAIVFEGLIGIGGRSFGSSTGTVLAAAIILVGVGLLVVNLLSDRRRDSG